MAGMLPALEIDGTLITESDTILHSLEKAFGTLGPPMADITPQRQLERQLFRAWCEWLCYPSSTRDEEAMGKADFEAVLSSFEAQLGKTPGPWLLGGDAPSTADIVFVPYVERMSASLYYYKGFTMREPRARPHLCRWFSALEARDSYSGTQSDFHTHVHDLPPQMGGCYANGEPQQRANAALVDGGPWIGLPDTGVPEPDTSRSEAAARVLKHRDALVGVNPCARADIVDEALRCALTRMLTGEAVQPPKGSDKALRYIRDRINVPRDMGVWAARTLRAALEETASLDGGRAGPPIPTEHRRDQNPLAFRKQTDTRAG
jgi:glutathione S-transferase